MVRQAPCRLHLNGSASDPLVCCTIKLPKFRPLKRVGLPRRPEAIGPREGKEGEQHAENLGLMDALRGGARAHVLNENGRLLH
jgi:hypothetical protein